MRLSASSLAVARSDFAIAQSKIFDPRRAAGLAI
jgi:hypothetical protein